MKLSVFGGGSWGTALAHQMARGGHDVRIWAMEPEVAEGINQDHRNPLFLDDLDLHEALVASNDLEEVAAHSTVWIWVVRPWGSWTLLSRDASLGSASQDS